MMKKAMPVMGGIVLILCPLAGTAICPLAGVAMLLWVFWDELGGLVSAVYDDRCVIKTRQALKSSCHADVGIFYAHALATRAREERLRRSRRWTGSLPGRLAAAKRGVRRALAGMEERTLSAIATAKFCIADFNSDGRSGSGEEAEVSLAVETDTWQGA